MLTPILLSVNFDLIQSNTQGHWLGGLDSYPRMLVGMPSSGHLRQKLEVMRMHAFGTPVSKSQNSNKQASGLHAELLHLCWKKNHFVLCTGCQSWEAMSSKILWQTWYSLHTDKIQLKCQRKSILFMDKAVSLLTVNIHMENILPNSCKRNIT